MNRRRGYYSVEQQEWNGLSDEQPDDTHWTACENRLIAYQVERDAQRRRDGWDEQPSECGCGWKRAWRTDEIEEGIGLCGGCGKWAVIRRTETT